MFLYHIIFDRFIYYVFILVENFLIKIFNLFKCKDVLSVLLSEVLPLIITLVGLHIRVDNLLAIVSFFFVLLKEKHDIVHKLIT